MRSLLLIEDDDNKRLQILQLVHDEDPDCEVVTARSLKSGLIAMKQRTVDAIILDMTLPTFDVSPGQTSGDTHVFGGREFLKEMRRFSVTTPVVVVTQFETFDRGRDMTTLEVLDAELARDYPDVYKGSVYYHAAIQSWRDDLRRLMGWPGR